MAGLLPDREPDIDLGHDHLLWFFGWHPDRALNPQYDGVPDVERHAALVSHKKPDGSECNSSITFDSEVARKVSGGRSAWTVESWEPLTVSPSLLCSPDKGGCGDHGFIREGRWVAA